VSTASLDVRTRRWRPDRGEALTRARDYFASSGCRSVQTVLGVLWLLDGVLQFQSSMYSGGLLAIVRAGAAGQPGWLSASIRWSAGVVGSDPVLWNTLFAVLQVAIGLGILCRATVRPALALSFAWAIVVWWFGEAFGMMLMSMAQPLTGAPGAVILYLLVGLLVWPGGRPGGLLGVRGARIAWAALWLAMAWLWLQAPSSAPGAVTAMINAAPSGMSWLSSLQDWFAAAARGNGLVIAVLLAAASAAIAVAVAANWRPRKFLVLAIGLNLLYWVVGQGFGGIFAGGATDPNAAPLFILLAVVLWTLTPYRLTTRTEREAASA
jgi:hypothetical protein